MRRGVRWRCATTPSVWLLTSWPWGTRTTPSPSPAAFSSLRKCTQDTKVGGHRTSLSLTHSHYRSLTQTHTLLELLRGSFLCLEAEDRSVLYKYSLTPTVSLSLSLSFLLTCSFSISLQLLVSLMIKEYLLQAIARAVSFKRSMKGQCDPCYCIRAEQLDCAIQSCICLYIITCNYLMPSLLYYGVTVQHVDE